MSRHRVERDHILQSMGAIPSGTGRMRTTKGIVPEDCIAVPQPLNLRPRPAGDCLVWRYGLNADGYGIGSFPGGETLAHRQVFKQTRLRLDVSNVLHFCHRPYCVQPSHLYEGSAQDNADDRKLRVTEGLEWKLFGQKADTAQKQARYRWEAPVNEHQPLIMVEAEHQCTHIIPAMDGRICPTCGSNDMPDAGKQLPVSDLQPRGGDKNAVEIVGHSRSFRDMGNGLVVQTDLKSTRSIPLTRAERRRREKAVRNDPMRDKPRMLWSQRVNLTEGGEVSIPVEGVTGPGVLLFVARPLAPSG